MMCEFYNLNGFFGSFLSSSCSFLATLRYLLSIASFFTVSSSPYLEMGSQ